MQNGNHDDEMRGGLRLLTILDGVQVEGTEGLLDVCNVHGWPKKFIDDISPNGGFRGTSEQEMISRISSGRADDTQRR